MNPLLSVLSLGVLPALNYLGQRETNKTNVKLAQKGNEFEERMWNLNNAYNTPLSQMNRLKEAGLNPNLIYGGGSANTGLSSSYPKAHVTQVQNEVSALTDSVLPVLNYYQDMKLKQAQVNAVNNNADLTLQKTINESLKGNLIGNQTDYLSASTNRIKSLLPYSEEAMKQNIERTRLGNKDMLYKLEKLNPLTASNLDTRNKLGLQQLNELNPALLKLRQIENSYKQLNYDFDSQLMKFGQTRNDSSISRALIKLFDNESRPKFDKSPSGSISGDIGLQLMKLFKLIPK